MPQQDLSDFVVVVLVGVGTAAGVGIRLVRRRDVRLHEGRLNGRRRRVVRLQSGAASVRRSVDGRVGDPDRDDVLLGLLVVLGGVADGDLDLLALVAEPARPVGPLAVLVAAALRPATARRRLGLFAWVGETG